MPVAATMLKAAREDIMSTVFRVILEGTQETPPNDSTASGEGTVIFDSEAVAASYSFDIQGVDFGPITGSAPQTPSVLDDVTRMHFHAQVRGQAGGIVFGQIAPANDPDDLAIVLNADDTWSVSGRWETTDTPSIASFSNILGATFSDVLGSAAVGSDVPIYFNVHTNEFGAGEIRGQLVAIADDIDNVVTGTIGDDGRDDAPLGGGNGNDAILGLAGNDILDGANGNDVLDGGGGDDALTGGNGNDMLFGSSGIDTLIGGNGDDSLDGGAGNDVLAGANGDDMLDGNAGDDRMTGGNGADIMNGGAGNDRMAGGDGPDQFVFNAGFGHDTIADLSNGDRIQFDSEVFATPQAVLDASEQAGDDTVITVDANNTVTLLGVQASSLQADDFLILA
jgi:serralysin